MTYKDIEKKREAQRRYRSRHPEVAKNDRARFEQWKQENPYVPVARYCECGSVIRRAGKNVCVPCEKKATKNVPIVCRKCRNVFVGDKRMKYCQNCKKSTSPSLLFAIKKAFHKARSVLNGSPAGFTRRDWLHVLSDFNNRCAYCGQEKKLSQDHFVPVTKGGGYTKNNIVPSCHSCNSKKSDSLPWEWLPRAKYQQIATYLQTR